MRSHAVLTLALAPLLLALGTAGCSSHAASPEAPRVARVARPTPAAEQLADVYPGEIHARYESALGFRVGGKIRARLVDVGAKVEAGQVLAELDPQDLALQVQSARATLSSAEADFALASSERERYAALHGKRFVSQFDFEAKDNAFKAAQARVSEAQATLRTMQNQAGYATLRADAAGVITALNAEVGQVVAAAQPIATLAHDGASEVEITVSENRIGAYAPGRAVAIELWAEPGRRYAGRLREIAPEADPTTRSFRVRVTIADAAAAPRLGQTARVLFPGDDGASGQIVPLAALAEKDRRPALWQLDPKTHAVHLAPVDVAAYREQGVLIASGLAADAWIVTAGVHKLREGELVTPVDALNRPVAL